MYIYISYILSYIYICLQIQSFSGLSWLVNDFGWPWDGVELDDLLVPKFLVD